MISTTNVVSGQAQNEAQVIAPATPIIDSSKAHYAVNETLNLNNPKNPLYGKVKLPPIGPSGKKYLVENQTITSETVAPAQAVNHIYWGAGITDNSNIIASAAVQQILPTYSVTGGNTLYAPTLMGPYNCPLEAVTVYFDGALVFGVWDHTLSSNQWIVYQLMDSSFKDKYVRNINGLSNAYQVEVVRTGSSFWQVYLYNFRDSCWDIIEYKNHNLGFTRGGWDMWEAYYSTPYPSQPQIQSTNVQVYDIRDNQLHNVDSSYGYSISSGDLTGYTRSFISNFYNWALYRT